MSVHEPILSISVAAKLLSVHPRTLMLYEKAGVIEPHRTTTKRRMFSLNDLENLQFIRFIIQEKGVNIQGVKILQEAIRLAKIESVDLKKLMFPQFKPRQLV